MRKIFLVLLVSSLCLLILSNTVTSEESTTTYISAIEAYNDVRSTIENHSMNVKITSIYLNNITDKNSGYSNSFHFRFNSENSSYLLIYNVGEPITILDDFNRTGRNVIRNWTIDSPEAYSIALNNDEFGELLEYYPTDSMYLGSDGWELHVDWDCDGPPSNNAVITIDHTNGEVKSVTFDNEKEPCTWDIMKNECFCISIIYLIIPTQLFLVALFAYNNKEHSRR